MLSRSYSLGFNGSGPSTASFVDRESAIPSKEIASTIKGSSSANLNTQQACRKDTVKEWAILAE
jgi:hypothetical protein